MKKFTDKAVSVLERGIFLKYQYWLSNIKGLGSRTILRVLQQTNSAEETYFLPKEQLLKLDALTEEMAERIIESKTLWNLDEKWEKLGEMGITFYSQEMEHFPETLKNISDAPYSIYVKGRLPEEKKRRIAIVGARRCSEYGRVMAMEIGKKLAMHKAQVISGMAGGIDSYGHMGALEGKGETFAVLGCGVDICYPWKNRELYEQIQKTGGIISEYPPGTQPRQQLFPARNRIISAFSEIIVVVEAKERSGSLITADFALEQGKDIYAVPGRSTDALSRGCNSLIRQGAGIITGVDEFLCDLEICTIKEDFQENFYKLLLEKDESMVYSCLDLQPKSINELGNRTHLSPQKLADVLGRLIQKEFVKEVFKNFYIRKI